MLTQLATDASAAHRAKVRIASAIRRHALWLALCRVCPPLRSAHRTSPAAAGGFRCGRCLPTLWPSNKELSHVPSHPPPDAFCALGRPQALPVAAGPGHPRHWRCPAGRLLANPGHLEPVVRRRFGAPHPARAGFHLRRRRRQPARRGPQGARCRPLLQLGALRLRAFADRRDHPGRLDGRHPGHALAPPAGPGHQRGHRQWRGHQHRARTWPQERQARPLAGPPLAGTDLLRPLLRRAQPRPPQERGHAGRSGQLALWRNLLGLLAAHRGGQPAFGLAPRGRAPAAFQQGRVEP